MIPSYEPSVFSHSWSVNAGGPPAAATVVGYMLGQNRRSEALRVVWTALAFFRAVATPRSTLRREKFQDLGMIVVRAFVASNVSFTVLVVTMIRSPSRCADGGAPPPGRAASSSWRST